MKCPIGIAITGVGCIAFLAGWMWGSHRPGMASSSERQVRAFGIRESPAAGTGEKRTVIEPKESGVDPAFLKPVTEDDRARIRLAVHQALEKEGGYPARMAAVCAALAKLTPENAAEFSRAFDESWLDGHDFATERTLFFFRLGEVTGADGLKHLDAMKEISSGDRDRVIEGWAGVDTTAATKWINALPDDKLTDGFIDSAFWGTGMQNPEYALDVFKLQDERRQKETFDALVRINRLRGGNQGVTDLARQLLASPEPAMQKWGETALKKARDIYKAKSPEALDQWMKSLPESSRAIVQPENH